jgi:Flp pilus assembly protein TadG
MLGLLSRLWRDQSGVMLPYITMMLVVFVGVGALALDGARYMSLQTQLQKAADAAAIAGAAELDRLTTSTGRAYNAIQNRMSSQGINSDLFGSNVTISNIRFFEFLPNQDNTAMGTPLCINNGCTTAQAVRARFVEVTVTPVTLQAILPIQFVNNALTNITAGAVAVAGGDQVNCGLTPLFICNPFEVSGDTYDQATARLETADADPAFKRKLIRLADHGPSGTWGPGDFGYLVPEPGSLPTDSCFPNAGDEIGKAMAMDRPLICVRQNGIDLLTGNANAAKNGLNTRFGIYPSGPLSDAACKTAYPPDRNVRKGMRPQGGGGWCTPTPDGSDTGAGANWPPGPNLGALGVDSCLIGNANCSPVSNIGVDTWNCLGYWNEAHPGGVTAPPGCTATASISRYDVYQYEIDNGRTGDQSATTHMPGSERETGTPQCTGTTPTADRRIMNVAIVNCMSSPVTIQSNAQNVPVAAFGRFFLTHAVTNQTRPYAEFRGLIDRGSGTVKDQVQLYR